MGGPHVRFMRELIVVGMYDDAPSTNTMTHTSWPKSRRTLQARRTGGGRGRG